MQMENLCNNGRCKKVRMGEERHSKHLNDNVSKNSDKDDVFRSTSKVQALFFTLVILGGILTYLSATSVIENPITKIIASTIAFIMIGLAFAVLNKGSTIHTEDRIRRIESKLDKILEHREF